MVFKGSENLEKYLDGQFDAEIGRKLDDLAGFGIDSKSLEDFRLRVANLIREEPEIKATVLDEIDKIDIGMRVAGEQYTGKVLDIVNLASNDNISRQSRRNYGGTGNSSKTNLDNVA